jgi:hypothetical protein
MRVEGLVVAIAVAVASSSETHAQEFHGYPCTQDCSGHKAGYLWAERHDITDPDDCSGNSQSFIEGCEAYAKEHEDEQVDDCDEDDPEDCE